MVYVPSPRNDNIGVTPRSLKLSLMVASSILWYQSSGFDGDLGYLVM